MPVPLRYSSLSSRWISIQVGDAQQNKSDRQAQSNLGHELAAPLTVQQIKLTECVTCSHDARQGNEGKEHELANSQRQHDVSSSMENRPKPSKWAKILRPDRIQ